MGYSDSEQEDEPNFEQGQGGMGDGFEKAQYDGLEGHMRLQLQKSYGGDKRFKLTEEFDVSLKDNHHISDVMLGALSKREQ